MRLLLPVLLALYLTGGPHVIEAQAQAQAQAQVKLDGPEPDRRVQFLSDIPGSTYEWLEEKQKDAYGPNRRPTSKADLLRMFDSSPKREGWDSGEALARDWIESMRLPTRYQELGPYILLNRVASDIRSTLDADHAVRSELIDWGTLPTGEVNASARKLGDRYLVVLDDVVFAAVYVLLLTVNRTVEFRLVEGRSALDYSVAAFERQLGRDPSILANYVDAVVAFAKGTSPPEIQFASEQEAANLMRQMNAVERFIVGHEFGHVIAGHADSGLITMATVRSRGVPYGFSRLGRDWNSEIQADKIGQELATKARKQDESGAPVGSSVMFDATAGYAPAVFFEILEAIEDSIWCDGNGQGSSRSMTEREIAQAYEETRATIERSSTGGGLSNVTLGCRQRDHPPAWLRAQFVFARADAKFLTPPRRPGAAVGYARALVENAQFLAKRAAPEIVRKLSAKE